MSAPRQHSKGERQLDDLAEKQQQSLLREFVVFLQQNRKWWLVPLLLALTVYGILLVVSLYGGIASLYTFF